MVTFVKVYFHLSQDEDGYPPAVAESLWAKASAKYNEYVIDNVPFFVRDVTVGDTIRVVEEKEEHWFDGVVSRSKNSLIRVIFFDRTCIEEFGECLTEMGCSVEYSKDHNLMAINIPYGVSLQNVQSYLQQEADAGVIDFEEPILRR